MRIEKSVFGKATNASQFTSIPAIFLFNLPLNLLHLFSVGSDHFRRFGFVFFQRFNRRFGIFFLPNSDNRVCNQNHKNHKWFHKCCN